MNTNDLKTKYSVNDYQEAEILIPDLSMDNGLNSLFRTMGIILIVGSSGSGKSTILNTIKKQEFLIDYEKSVIEQFNDLELGEKLLIKFQLNKTDTWFRPMRTLSNGEQHRAELALYMAHGVNVIDEFTSVVDRKVAHNISAAVKSVYEELNLDYNLYIASCHKDVEEWLDPILIYDTDKKIFKNESSEQKLNNSSKAQLDRVGYVNVKIEI